MPDVEIMRGRVSLGHLVELATSTFGDLVKAVVDVERRIMAIGGELHADVEAALLADGSRQAYPHAGSTRSWLRSSMTTELHPGLAAGRWAELSLVEQLANVGSEVGRASRAKAAGNVVRFEAALARALELFDLTLDDPRWRNRYREIARARELVCDFLVGDNEHSSSAVGLDAYFLAFARAARRGM